MSVLPPTADIGAPTAQVRFVPTRDDVPQQTPASFDYFVGPDKRCGLEPHAELGGYLQV